MVNVSKAYAKAIKSLWDGKCTVSVRKYETNEKNGRSEPKEVKTIEGEPCRISYKTIEPTREGEGVATRRQVVILYIDKDVNIPEGSKITVTHKGKTKEYAQSGTPALYSVHKEVPLELFRGWA